MQNHSHKKTNGFTLLEILVALFIFTIISVIMTHALHNIFQTQDVTEKHAARLAELQMAMLLFSRDIEQSIERPIINTKRDIEPALIGTNKDIAFTHSGLANPQGDLPRSTLQRVAYSLEKNNLIRQTWEVLDQAPTSKSSSRNLLNNVNKIRFDYLDYDNHYNDRWPPANKPKAPIFPKAVKLSLELAHWGTITQVYRIPGRTLATELP
jgi:general secretion pathway protein J